VAASLQGCEDFRALSHDELRQRIFEAGIAGLGGAGFPTAYKLGGDAGKRDHTLILNGTECEPYITADDRLMRERAAAVIGGMRGSSRTWCSRMRSSSVSRTTSPRPSLRCARLSATTGT
jgi:Na+-translocating ferredoxin:NAD+ oxidoreductase RnfC subunit